LVEPSPQVQLRIESGNTGDLLEGLRQYRLDFVIADAGRLPPSGATPDYQVRPLTQSRIRPVISRGHPLSARQAVSLAEALAYPWVTPTIPDGMRQVLSDTLLRDGAPEGAFARLAVLPDVRIEDLSACMHVASQSLCIATTLASADAETNLPGRLQPLPLDLGLTTHIAVMTLRARTPSPLAARAMNLLAGSGPAISAANPR
jgi:DNA-binding transcriptional LysR family regulator